MRYLPCLMLIGAACAPLHAQPDLTLDWCIVGDPGNRDTTIEETEGFFRDGFERGRVDYPFRILETEVTVAQHFRFVEAYFPLYSKRVRLFASFDFVGFDITASIIIVRINPGIDPQRPSSMSWEYFARYCNWLHHGMVNEPWAYDSGVYDTSTFFEDPPGVWHFPLTRSPEARYWIPSLDEWIKAAHWDQSLNDGQGGYWQYSTGSNEPPLPGLPEDGGDRNAGHEDEFPIAVRSYSHIKSYYGLYDLAGGYREIIEDARSDMHRERRRANGSQYNDVEKDPDDPFDLLGVFTSIAAQYDPYGLRPAGTETASSDLNKDGRINYFDISMFLRLYLDGDLAVDFRKDNDLNIDDVRVFMGLYQNNL